MAAKESSVVVKSETVTDGEDGTLEDEDLDEEEDEDIDISRDEPVPETRVVTIDPDNLLVSEVNVVKMEQDEEEFEEKCGNEDAATSASTGGGDEEADDDGEEATTTDDTNGFCQVQYILVVGEDGGTTKIACVASSEEQEEGDVVTKEEMLEEEDLETYGEVEGETEEANGTASTSSTNNSILVVPNSTRPYACGRCDYSAVRKDTLLNHVSSVHEGVRPFACSVCNFRTARKGTLVRHIRVVHEQAKPFVCSLCDYRTFSQAKLTAHVGKVHRAATVNGPIRGVPPEAAAVTVGATTTTAVAAQNKVRRRPRIELDLDDRPPIRAENGRIIVLSQEEENRTVLPPVVIQQPAVRLKQRQGLDGQIVSTGEAENLLALRMAPTAATVPTTTTVVTLPVVQDGGGGEVLITQEPLSGDFSGRFPCPECGYRAVNQYKLNAHVRIVHEKRKPFACLSCPFRTVTANKLANHVAEVHDRQKPFRCHLCNFRSARQYNLNVHVSQVHHQEKPFGCALCDFKAPRKDKVRRHLYITHGKVGEVANGLINVRKIVSSDQLAAAINLATAEEQHVGVDTLNDSLLSALSPVGVANAGAVPFMDMLPKTPAPPDALGLVGGAHQQQQAVQMTIDVHEEEIVVEETPFELVEQLSPAAAEITINGGGGFAGGGLEKIAAATAKTPRPSGKRRVISAEEIENRKFRCELCDYKAARSNTLKMHVIAVHDRAKNYLCAHCDYRTARRGDLNRHLRTVHKEAAAAAAILQQQFEGTAVGDNESSAAVVTVHQDDLV